MKRLLVALLLTVILIVTFATPALAYPPPESGQKGLSVADDALDSRPPPGYGMAWGWRICESIIGSIIGGWFPPPPWIRYG